MKILITGGAGFIGTHLVERCLKDGHEVRVIDDFSTGVSGNMKNGAKYYTENVSKMGFEPFMGTDVIFHVAAKASIPWSIEKPVESHNENIGATLWVLELARKTGAKVIYSSSSSVLYEPQTPYSVQKRMGEEYLNLYKKLYGIKGSALRYFNVFGEGQERANGGYALVLSRFLEQKHIRHEPFTIYGDGEQRRDFVYVGDVVEANIKALEWDGIYSIGSGENISINELANMIDPYHDKVYLEPRIEPLEMKADITEAKKMGWNPELKLEKWLKRVS